MRRSEASRQLNNSVIHIGGQVGYRAGCLSATPTVPAEDESKTRHHESNFVIVEIRSCPRTERRDAVPFKRIDVSAAVFLADTMQQQRDLAVILYDPTVFKKS